jgi:hypothetical protein
VCSALNPASLLPTEEGSFTHSHEEVLAECYSARPDLLDQSLPDPDLTLFTDGSSLVQEGIRHVGQLWCLSLRPHGLSPCLLPLLPNWLS